MVIFTLLDNLAETKRLLNPVDRAGEVLFGLIMSLSFTCSISIANSSATEVRQLLIAALSCNFTWGIIDGSMYLIGVSVKRNRNKLILDHVLASTDIDKTRKFIAETMPPIVASLIETEALEALRNKLKQLPAEKLSTRLPVKELSKAGALFLLVFASTFPGVIPFLFISDAKLALRLSNLVAIVMMFLCGWSVARYSGINKWKFSFGLVIVGSILVLISIVLGG